MAHVLSGVVVVDFRFYDCSETVLTPPKPWPFPRNWTMPFQPSLQSSMALDNFEKKHFNFGHCTMISIKRPNTSWLWPPHGISDHREYHIFSRGSL